MIFGAHVSVADGYLQALDYAESVGCECMQIFAKSPRQWNGPAIDRQRAKEFVAQREARGFGPVFTHAAYLINLATDDAAMRERSIAALADELIRGAALGAAGVVTHVGTDPLLDAGAAAQRVGEAVNEAFEIAGPMGEGTRLLLENTAGAGRTFGGSVHELAACLRASGRSSASLGICIDTCHAFASGMALDTADGWDDLIAEIATRCGLERLGLVHANDSLHERGSRRDRHAWIGDGAIGVEGFRAMVARPELADVAACTEMSGEKPEKDAINIARLKAFRGRSSSHV